MIFFIFNDDCTHTGFIVHLVPGARNDTTADSEMTGIVLIVLATVTGVAVPKHENGASITGGEPHCMTDSCSE